MRKKQRLPLFFRGRSPLGLAVLVAGGVFILLSDNFFYLEILMLAAIYAIFAMSWDILTGYTHEVNFGFAFFIGGAGYISGIGRHARKMILVLDLEKILVPVAPAK